MRKIISSIIPSIVSILSFSFLALAPVTVHAAGSAQLFVSPASGSYVQGATFKVNVYENGTDVQSVTANMFYSAANLQCLGVAGGAAFPGAISSACANGNINISRYINPGSAGVSGNQVVASVTFKALAPSGTGTLKFAGDSQIASNGTDQWNGDISGNAANFTLTAPAPPVKKPVPPKPVTGAVEGATTQTPPADTTPTPAKKTVTPIKQTATVAPKEASKAVVIWSIAAAVAAGGAAAYYFLVKPTIAKSK